MALLPLLITVVIVALIGLAVYFGFMAEDAKHKLAELARLRTAYEQLDQIGRASCRERVYVLV